MDNKLIIISNLFMTKSKIFPTHSYDTLNRESIKIEIRAANEI